MSKRFHITEDGPKPCKAHKRPCKYGNRDEHFKNETEAVKAYEAKQSSLPEPSKKSVHLAPNRVLALYEKESKWMRRVVHDGSSDLSYYRQGRAPGDNASIHKLTLKEISKHANLPLGEVQELLLQGRAEKNGTSLEAERDASLREKHEKMEKYALKEAYRPIREATEERFFEEREGDLEEAVKIREDLMKGRPASHWVDFKPSTPEEEAKHARFNLLVSDEHREALWEKISQEEEEKAEWDSSKNKE